MGRTLLSLLIWLYYGIVFFVMFPFVSVAFILSYPFDRSRRVANWVMFQFGRFLVPYCPFWPLTIEGKNKSKHKEPVIYVSNHQSFLDMPLQAALPVRFKWVSKKSLFSVPFMGWMMSMSGQIPVERGKTSGLQVLEQLDPYLSRGDSIMIFPEGTRSRDGTLLPFKLGAFTVSKRKGYPVHPIVIDGTSKILQREDWRFKVRIPLHIKVLDTMNPADYQSAEEMRDRAVEMITQALGDIRSKSHLQ